MQTQRRIAVIEDEATIAGAVAARLRSEGFDVEIAREGVAGVDLCRTYRPDLVVLDLMLPGMDGLALIEELRRRRIAVPVIILSAKRSVDDRVRGLQAGGDDYLTKPFAFEELLARVQALIRRATGAAEPTRLAVGDLALDLVSRKVERAGRALELRPREYALLEYLMRNAGRVVSKAMILSHVFDYSFDPRTNVVDVLVHRLRDKVDKGFDAPMIHTVRGMGYVLRPA
jgi:two-component system OmpR family response regulator